jgi:hypothetical protein
MVSGWLILADLLWEKTLLNGWLILADKIKRTGCMWCIHSKKCTHSSIICRVDSPSTEIVVYGPFCFVVNFVVFYFFLWYFCITPVKVCVPWCPLLWVLFGQIYKKNINIYNIELGSLNSPQIWLRSSGL